MLSARLFTWADTWVLLSRCLECPCWKVLCGRELGVTVWQADSSLSDKAPVLQHLNEGTAGPGRTARSREESSDHQTSLVTSQAQGQGKESRWSVSSARCKTRCKARCSEPIISFREKSNTSPDPMGRGCPSGKSRCDSTSPAPHTFPVFMEIGFKVTQLCAIRAAFGRRQTNL